MDTQEQQQEKKENEKKRCDTYVKNGLTHNKTIRFLLDQLEGMGCIPPSGFFRCTDCGELQATGGFQLVQEETTTTNNDNKNNDNNGLYHNTNAKDLNDKELLDRLKQIKNTDGNCAITSGAGAVAAATTASTKPEIFLCQEHATDEQMTHRTMIHELIHAVDTCRTNMDPKNNCIHLACAEIRAENLSGECQFWPEFWRMGPHSLNNHGQQCVERRATLSVSAHPKCAAQANKYVKASMNRCYNDIFPFPRHPSLVPSYESHHTQKEEP